MFSMFLESQISMRNIHALPLKRISFHPPNNPVSLFFKIRIHLSYYSRPSLNDYGLPVFQAVHMICYFPFLPLYLVAYLLYAIFPFLLRPPISPLICLKYPSRLNEYGLLCRRTHFLPFKAVVSAITTRLVKDKFPLIMFSNDRLKSLYGVSM